MEPQELSDQIKFHIDALARLGVKIKPQKKRIYTLRDKGVAWRDFVDEVKARPENLGKNMRDILKLASAERKATIAPS